MHTMPYRRSYAACPCCSRVEQILASRPCHGRPTMSQTLRSIASGAVGVLDHPGQAARRGAAGWRPDPARGHCQPISALCEPGPWQPMARRTAVEVDAECGSLEYAQAMAALESPRTTNISSMTAVVTRLHSMRRADDYTR
jgi:hypothetical protein